MFSLATQAMGEFILFNRGLQVCPMLLRLDHVSLATLRITAGETQATKYGKSRCAHSHENILYQTGCGAIFQHQTCLDGLSSLPTPY